MSLITVKNLSAYYENREVFKNLNFTVSEGDYLCIVGENGSGKTTLMKTLLGMNIKHTGDISFNGFDRREIGWLPQKTQEQMDFPASAFEVVLSGFSGSTRLRLGQSKKMKKSALENMKRLDILELKGKSFRELSGGQQQKVLLCRALCAAKKVLLLDEASTGLDSSSKKELYSIIRKLNESGIAIIMILHDVEFAISQAKHILCLYEGESFFGTAEEFSCYKKGDI